MDSLDATPDASSDESLESLDNETIETEGLSAQEDESQILDDSEELPSENEEKPEPKPKAKKPDEKSASKAKAAEKSKAARELGDEDLDAMVTVKIDGEVKKISLRDLQKGYGLEQASQKRLQEAATERRRLAQMMKLAEENPQEWMKLANISPEKFEAFATEMLAKKFEDEARTPQEKAQMAKDARLDAYEKQERQAKDNVINEIEKYGAARLPDKFRDLPKERLEQVLTKVKADHQQLQSDLDQEIGTAWKESGLPEDADFVQRIAAEMRNHQLRTGEALQAKEAAAIVKKKFETHVSRVVSKMDASAIRDLLGKETMKKLSDFEIARATGRAPASAKPKDERPANQAASDKKIHAPVMNEHEARAYMREALSSLRD